MHSKAAWRKAGWFLLSAAPASTAQALTLTIILATLRIHGLNHLQEEHYLRKGWQSLPFDLILSKPSNKPGGCLCVPAVPALSQPLPRERFLMDLTRYLNWRAARSTFRDCEAMVLQPRTSISVWNLIPHMCTPSYLSKSCINRKCFQRSRQDIWMVWSGFSLDSRTGIVEIVLEINPVVKNQIGCVKRFRIILEERCCRNIRYY